MDDVQKLEIASLSAILHNKRQRLQMLGLMNTSMDPNAARQQGMQYAVAQAEVLNAEVALRQAQIRASSP